MYISFVKRLFDLLFVLLFFPIFLVFFVLIGIIIKIEDQGPIFYKAKRIGKNSKPLYMYKFRSMKVDAPDIRNLDGSTYNSKNDERVTRIGRVIRSFSIDELPQIINVLQGNMSIIGPRASEWDALKTYRVDEMDKMNVLPGITGYTQAYYRNGLSVREKRLKDAWYANNVSLSLDIKIFFKTIVTVLSHKNLYTNE